MLHASHHHLAPLRQVLLLDAVNRRDGLLLVTSAGFSPGHRASLRRCCAEPGLSSPFSALVAGRFREPSPTGAVLTIIAGNVIWVAASLLLLISGYVAPTLADTSSSLLRRSWSAWRSCR